MIDGDLFLQEMQRNDELEERLRVSEKRVSDYMYAELMAHVATQDSQVESGVSDNKEDCQHADKQ